MDDIDRQQLALTLGPLFRVRVQERFTPRLSGREDRGYLSPPQERAQALVLAALLLDSGHKLEGYGPWQRAIAGGRRTVEIEPEEAPS